MLGRDVIFLRLPPRRELSGALISVEEALLSVAPAYLVSIAYSQATKKYQAGLVVTRPSPRPVLLLDRETRILP